MLRIKLLLFFILILNNHAILSQNKFVANYIDTPLNEALEEFSERYNVDFGYDPTLLDSIFITVNINTNDELSAIKSILKGTGFNSLKVNDINLIQPNKVKEKGVIHGFIKDFETNENLPYALIYNEKSKNGTSSSSKGYYSFEILKKDTIEITCTYLGYKKETIKVNWKRIEKPINIKLNKETRQISEIIVKSINSYSGLETNSNSYSINIKKMQNLPKVGENDIFYSLKYIPGVNATNETSSGIEIRGCPADQSLVLFDGMPLYHLDHFFGTFSALNSMVVKNVQLYKSGYPARFGGRVAGIIDIIGKTGNSNKISGGININMLSSSLFIETPLFKNATLLIAGRRSYTDLIKTSFYKKISGKNINGNEESTYSFGGDIRNISNEAIPDFYYYDFNAKLSWKITEKDLLTISYYQGYDHYSVVNNDSVAYYSYNTSNKTYWGNQAANIEWDKQWTKKLNSKISCSLSGFNNSFERDGYFHLKQFSVDSVRNISDNKINDLSLRFNNDVNFSDLHNFGFGIEWSAKEIAYKRFNQKILVEREISNSNELALYVQDRINLWKRLNINVGLRLNYFDKANTIDIEPRLSLKYQLFENLFLKGAYSLHNQYISKIIARDYSGNQKDFWVLSNNENIPSIHSSHCSLGLLFNIENIKIDIEFYRMNFWRITANQIPASNLTYNPSVFYLGEGYSKGIDFFMQRTGEILNTTLSYTIGRSVQKFDEIELGKEFPSVNDQLHEFKFIQSYKLRNWDFVLTWIYGSGKPYTKPYGTYTIDLIDGSKLYESNVSSKNNFRLPDYHRMDLAINYGWQIKSINAQVGFSLINIYNHKNVRSINYFVNNDIIEGEKKTVIIENVVKSLGFTPNISLNLSF